jgi:hypothetical protein
MTRLVTADASRVSGADFFAEVFGRQPKSKAEREAETVAFWAEYRKQARAELEALRDRLCAMASPELAAKWRAKWADEDSAAEAREQRRAA